MERLTEDQCREISRVIKERIDAHCVERFDDGFRRHLGASVIGRKCARQIWYGFRWCMKVRFSARMLRLFNRGHREEPHNIALLRGIGFVVRDLDEDGKQMRLSAHEGHFGGSQDGMAYCELLAAYPALANGFLLEFKTKATGAGFQKLTNNGVRKEAVEHFVQMSIYGKHRGFRYALYITTNKNDDDMYVELVELDWTLADDAERKALDVILARRPPKRLHENAAMLDCKICDFLTVCHGNERYAKNCRSCAHSRPDVAKSWFCEIHNATIPEDVIAQGCPNYAEAR